MQASYPNDGTLLRIPAARFGGSEGSLIQFGELRELESLLDSLSDTKNRFGLRIKIATWGEDANEADNSGTKEWGSWISLFPESRVASSITLSAIGQRRPIVANLKAFRVPPSVHINAEALNVPTVVYADAYRSEFDIHTPAQLPHGIVLGFRLTAVDSLTGQVLSQHERFAVFDTIPPVVTGYRVILGQDGFVGIQVTAFDQHAGLEWNAVTTVYSVDGGQTWSRKLHQAAQDEFGRPTHFECILGPFVHFDSLLLGFVANDVAGNSLTSIPETATLFVAPNAIPIGEQPLSKTVGGSAVFRHEDVEHLSRSMASEGASRAADYLRANINIGDAFEKRRRDDLRSLVLSLKLPSGNVSEFKEMTAKIVSGSVGEGLPRTLLVVRAWR